MHVSKTRPDDTTVILTLPADCTVRNIATIAADARKPLSAGQGISIDCSAIESADFTFVQLMVSARRSFETQSLPFALDQVPPAVLAAFSRAGVPAPATTSSLSGVH